MSISSFRRGLVPQMTLSHSTNPEHLEIASSRHINACIVAMTCRMKVEPEAYEESADVKQRMHNMDRQFNTDFTDWVTDPLNLHEIRIYLDRTLDQMEDHSQLSQVILFITEFWPIADAAELIFTTIPFHKCFLTIISDIVKQRSFYDAVDLLSFVCVDESYPRLKKIVADIKRLDIVDIKPYLYHVASKLSWRSSLINELYD